MKKYACRGEERLHNMACFPGDLGMNKSSSLDYNEEGGRKCWAEVHQSVGYTIWLGCQVCKRPLNGKLESMEGRVDPHTWGWSSNPTHSKEDWTWTWEAHLKPWKTLSECLCITRVIPASVCFIGKACSCLPGVLDYAMSIWFLRVVEGMETKDLRSVT